MVWFTKVTAGTIHKRWWATKISDKKRAIVYLDLLENMMKRSRGAIVTDLCRKNKSAGSIEDIASYIKHYLGDIVESWA